MRSIGYPSQQHRQLSRLEKHMRINNSVKRILTITTVWILQACSELQQDLQWVGIKQDANLDAALAICEAQAEAAAQSLKVKYEDLRIKDKLSCEQSKQSRKENVTIYGDAVVINGRQKIDPDYTICVADPGTSFSNALAVSRQRKLSLKSCMAENGFIASEE